MRVISEKALREFWQAHKEAERALRSWIKIVKKSQWRNFAEVRNAFNSADLKGVFTIFDVRGNAYRIVTAIHYNTQRVYIRYVFTHPEYDRWNKG